MSITSRTTRLLVALGMLAAIGLAACRNPAEQVSTNEVHGFNYVKATDAEGPKLVRLSEVLLESATAVVLAPQPITSEAVAAAKASRLPLLPDSTAGKAEAERLGARALSVSQAEQLGGSASVAARGSGPTVLLTNEPGASMSHLIELVGGTSKVVAKEPRKDPESITTIQQSRDVVVVSKNRYRFEAVYQGARAVNDSFLFFPENRIIALYGHPETKALGVLGAQGPKKSVRRIKELVEKYERVAPDETFVPAFEIIATVASADAGKRKDYSRRTPIKTLEPLVDAAEKAGVLVVLDLQPGRASMLEQAKYYEPLLKRPHVGLALDPEWKLGPKGKHLVRIGHVKAKEVNEVSAWLAELTRENILPQKLFVLHQFTPHMIRQRSKVVTSHPELATVIHVDGQGPPAAKHGTWRRVRSGAPKGVRWGWKNFYKEDKPMLTVRKTWRQVKPHPALITYQ